MMMYIFDKIDDDDEGKGNNKSIKQWGDWKQIENERNYE